MSLAALAISGFLLRGYWVLRGSALHRNRATKILPHVIDALFLASGIWLIAILNLSWLQLPWLLAKFAGLFVYISLGMVAFRFGRTKISRSVAFAGAVAAFAYIVGAAITKSTFSWFAYLAL